MNISDDILIQHAQQGNERASTQLVERYHEEIFNRLINDEALHNGKRIVVVPTELLDVTKSLRPYLQTSWGNPIEKRSTEVEIYSPDKVNEELLEIFSLSELQSSYTTIDLCA